MKLSALLTLSLSAIAGGIAWCILLNTDGPPQLISLFCLLAGWAFIALAVWFYFNPEDKKQNEREQEAGIR